MTNFEGTRLYVGDIKDNNTVNETEWAVVHATQTAHYAIFGWDRGNKKPDKSHPSYIVYEKDNHMSLNWVDGASFLYKWSGPQLFIRILDFIEKWEKERNVLVHCDQGVSRSPTVCLLYLSKRKGSISNLSYEDAKKDFIKLYPDYNAGGIGDYVKVEWNNIK